MSTNPEILSLLILCLLLKLGVRGQEGTFLAYQASWRAPRGSAYFLRSARSVVSKRVFIFPFFTGTVMFGCTQQGGRGVYKLYIHVVLVQYMCGCCCVCVCVCLGIQTGDL